MVNTPIELILFFYNIYNTRSAQQTCREQLILMSAHDSADGEGLLTTGFKLAGGLASDLRQAHGMQQHSILGMHSILCL